MSLAEDGLRTETCSAVTKKKMMRVRWYLGKPDLITTQGMQNTSTGITFDLLHQYYLKVRLFTLQIEPIPLLNNTMISLSREVTEQSAKQIINCTLWYL
jgi:hypothetical protein